MSRFEIQTTPLDGLYVVRRQAIADTRGFLSRLFCAEALAEVGWKKPVAQINHTCTAQRGTVRGMHFQKPPHVEAKLVSCLQGAVWDVAIDVRKDSPTLGQHYALELSADNHTALLIPEGFAHGFQTLMENAHLLYCHSTAYAPHAEAGLNPFDAKLAIAWPLAVAEVSARDREHPMMTGDFRGFAL